MNTNLNFPPARFAAVVAAGLALLSATTTRAQSTWNGGGAPDGNFSNGANWVGGTAPNTSAGATLNFDGSTQVIATNNMAFITTADNTVNFNATAGGFTLWGNSLRVGSINNNSAVMQAVMFSARLNGTRAWNVGSGGLFLGRPVGSTGSGTRLLVKSGTGDLIVGAITATAGDNGGSSYIVNQGALVFSNGLGQATTLGTSSSIRATNTGVIKFINSGTVSAPGGIFVGSGAALSLNNSGSVLAATGGIWVSNGASLTGSGVLGSATTVLGTVAPGSSGIGTISVTDLTLDSGATNVMDIDRSSGQKSDLISASGLLTFGGTLDVVNVGPTLVAGDSFDLFTFGSMSGSFASTNLPTLDPGLTWSWNVTGAGETLSVTTVPEPMTGALLGLGIAAAAILGRRKA